MNTVKPEVLKCNKLPIVENPPLKGYVYLAYPCSIILTHKGSEPWIYNNYIQLVFTENPYGVNFFFETTFFTHQPTFEREHIADETIERFNINKLDLVKHMIEQEKYIYIVLDEYYMPQSNEYHKNHFMHDWLIYGYDDVNQYLNVIGYSKEYDYISDTYKLNVYKTSVLPYEVFNESNPCSWEGMKFNDNYIYRIDMIMILLQLKQYLNILPTRRDCVAKDEIEYFGLEACYKLKEHYIRRMEKNEYIDFRYMHILWEHKECMKNRLIYLKENMGLNELEESIAQYITVVEIATKLRKLTLKYASKYVLNDKVTSEFYEKYDGYFSQMMALEKECIKSIIQILELYK